MAEPNTKREKTFQSKQEALNFIDTIVDLNKQKNLRDSINVIIHIYKKVD
jgi:hypothetical protein